MMIRSPRSCRRFDRFRRRCLDRVGDGHQSGELLIDGDEHHRAALPLQLVGPVVQVREDSARPRSASSDRLPIRTFLPSTVP